MAKSGAAALTAAIAFTLSAISATAGCGTNDDACEVPMGTYHTAIPETDTTDPLPAILFLHGGGSNGLSMVNNMGIAKTANARGYAFLAPNGVIREGRTGGSWSFHPEREKLRDETAFFKQVIADAVEKFNIDPDQVILSGFSIGGSMTTYTACEDPNTYSAFAPVAGSFWRPHPTEPCAAPVRLLHTHGWRDTTVPLEGRPIPRFNITQGDVFVGMQVWRETNGCTGLRADRFKVTEQFWHRIWDRCDDGSALEFVLFPGAHGVPRGWADLMLNWYEALDAE
jgi:polyhydroxybutyrate depolymerase